MSRLSQWMVCVSMLTQLAFAQTTPPCAAECAAQGVRLVVEDYPMDGLGEALEPFAADPGVAAVELLFEHPGDASTMADLERQITDAGFERRSGSRAVDGLGEQAVAALYFRAPQRILTLAADDERSIVISKILWAHRTLFVWSRNGDEVELWTSNKLAPHVSSLLATSDELDSDALKLDPPTCAGELPRAISRPHRLVVLSGENEAQTFEALRTEARQPSSPWMLEVLCDEEMLDTVIDTVTAPVFALGAWRDRGFSYGWLGLPQPFAEELSNDLYSLSFGVMPRGIDRMTTRLWVRNYPVRVEPDNWTHYGEPYLPAFAHAAAIEQGLVPDSESSSSIELGSAVPPLRVPLLSGETLDLGVPAPHKTLLLFASHELRFGDVLLRLLEEPLMECNARGDSIRLVIVPKAYEEPAWPERIGGTLGPHTDIVVRACEDYGWGDDGWAELIGRDSYPPTNAILLDADNRVLARIDGHGIFELFAARLQEALGVTPCALATAVGDAPPEPAPTETFDGSERLRLERVAVIEEWASGEPVRLWNDRMNEIVDEVALRVSAAMSTSSCVGIELAFPGDMDEHSRARIDVVLANSGFERVGDLRAILRDWGDHYRVAQFHADPRSFCVLSPEDSRITPITGALWESRVPFTWGRTASGIELTIPGRAESWARAVLAHSPLLEGMELDDLGVSRALAPPPRYREETAWRVAILAGRSENAAFERLREHIDRPLAPWAIEVLADSYTWIRSTEFADPWVRLHGKRLLYDFAYESFGWSEETDLCPTEVLFHIPLGVAPNAAPGGVSGMGRTPPLTRRLWETGVPFAWELSMAAYPYTAGFHHARVNRAIAMAPDVDFPSWDFGEELAIGRKAPLLLGSLSDGGSADLSRFRGRSILLLFHFPYQLNNLDLFELRRAYREAEAQGEVPLLIVRPSWSPLGNLLHLVPGVSERALVLEQDEDQRERAGFDFGLSGDGQQYPVGFLIDAEGRIAAHIGGDGLFWTFRDELRAALGLK